MVRRASAFINAELSTKDGRSEIDRFDNDNVEALGKLVAKVVSHGLLNENAKDYVSSAFGQVEMADWINRTGEPTTLLEFVQGKPVTIGGRQVRLAGPMTSEVLRSYILNTKAGYEEEDLNERRIAEARRVGGGPGMAVTPPDQARGRPGLDGVIELGTPLFTTDPRAFAARPSVFDMRVDPPPRPKSPGGNKS